MTPEGAKKLAIGGVIVTGVLASVEHIQAGHAPPLRVFLGAVIVGAALTALADPAPQLAAGFAVLLMLGALLGTGVRAITTIRKAID